MTHPARRLTAPDGTVAAIDTLLVPLIEALWAAGYDTISSCQDLGERLPDYPRKNAYWKGYAMLEMPPEDACRLIDAVKDTTQFRDRMHWTDDGAWEMDCQLMPGTGATGEPSYLVPWVSIHFPNDQIDDLIKVLQDEETL